MTQNLSKKIRGKTKNAFSHRKFNPYDFVNDGGYDKMVLEL